MNWDAAGAIGEIIGAVAVVATLIYLSIQTRLTRKSVEEASVHAFQQATHTAIGMYSDWRRTIMGAPHLAAIIVKAQQGSSLDPDERLLYSICFQDLFLAAAASYRGVVHDTAGYDESISVTHLVSVLTANPLSIEIWREVEFVTTGICAEFVEEVNGSLEKSAI